jgi:hypothetical protein
LRGLIVARDRVRALRVEMVCDIGENSVRVDPRVKELNTANQNGSESNRSCCLHPCKPFSDISKPKKRKGFFKFSANFFCRRCSTSCQPIWSGWPTTFDMVACATRASDVRW